jgi:hypothetical protein
MRLNRRIAYLESVVSPAEDFDRSFGSSIFFREDRLGNVLMSPMLLWMCFEMSFFSFLGCSSLFPPPSYGKSEQLNLCIGSC